MRRYFLFILPLLVLHLYQTELVFAQWQKPIILRAGNIHEIAYSPDGKLLAVADGAGIWLYNAKNLDIIELLQGHKGDVYSIAFSPDGRILASGGMDDTVRLWDLNEKKQIGSLKAHKPYLLSLSFSPDGKLLASGCSDGTIRIWD